MLTPAVACGEALAQRLINSPGPEIESRRGHGEEGGAVGVGSFSGLLRPDGLRVSLQLL